ncbi:MAG TPA: VOC family protein [Candidatus Binataceae bacterium]|jgi:catechol 2,3-dioxygenase-like lactoylglutathione lyase family enzyme|nr:VOC family protein [Candidatus Binataceae bacterium]
MPNIRSIFHVNINVTDFERSLEFYQTLGFRVIRDLGEGGNRKMARGLGASECRGRAVLMILGDNPRATRLDLIEWKNPPTEGRAYPHLFHAGICRIALRTRSLLADYEELKARGVQFLSEPQVFDTPNGPEGFVCLTDPDGTVIELIQV